MNRFKFKLESLLKQKQWEEDEAKRLLGQEIQVQIDLQNHLRTLESEYQSLIQMSHEQRTSESTIPMQADIQLQSIQYSKHILSLMQEQHQKIQQQQNVVNIKTQELSQKIIEKKKVEKLKERQLKKHQILNKKQTGKQMDEAATNFTLFSENSF